VTSDVTRVLAPLQGHGYHWDPSTQTLKNQGVKTIGLETPWCHAIGTHTKNCLLDHHIAFKFYKIIPPACLECWKVVATPNTFAQLMQMEKLQRDLTYPCKCGIELRDYTPKHYGSYFYNDSLDEGRDKYEKVRKLCDEEIEGGKDINVLLKRGCTEFEIEKGPSPFWHMTKEEERVYDIIVAYVCNERNLGRQPELAKKHIKVVWALWAHANGDMSYQPWNNNESLFPDYVKYHKGDINGIKADLAMARGTTRGGLKPATTLRFLKLAEEFANNEEVPLTSLPHAFGIHEKAALDFKVLPNFEPEVIGEHDETT
ncbi:MAG: hypothetical protein ACERKJ_07890, partial [Candidatus Dadabacteria bacterium]